MAERKWSNWALKQITARRQRTGAQFRSAGDDDARRLAARVRIHDQDSLVAWFAHRVLIVTGGARRVLSNSRSGGYIFGTTDHA